MDFFSTYRTILHFIFSSLPFFLLCLIYSLTHKTKQKRIASALFLVLILHFKTDRITNIILRFRFICLENGWACVSVFFQFLATAINLFCSFNTIIPFYSHLFRWVHIIIIISEKYNESHCNCRSILSSQFYHILCSIIPSNKQYCSLFDCAICSLPVDFNYILRCVVFNGMKTKRKKNTQLIFSLSIGICFYWANFLWTGKTQPNQLNWMNGLRHKKNHTQLQFTVFESQQLSVTCGSFLNLCVHFYRDSWTVLKARLDTLFFLFVTIQTNLLYDFRIDGKYQPPTLWVSREIAIFFLARIKI